MESNAYHNSSNPKHDEVMAEVDKYFKENFNNKTDRTVFRWIAKHDSNTCKTCQEMDGVEHENIEDFPFIPPIHPNCKCEIIEVSASEEKCRIGDKAKQEEVEVEDKDMIKTLPILKKDEEFQKILSQTAAIEGGYKPADGIDTGGETNMGITKRWYPDENIKNLSRDRADYLLYRDYYVKPKINQLPIKLREIVFDNAVNQGQATAIMNLQKAVDVKADGVIGPKTLEAVENTPFEEIRSKLKANITKRYKEILGKDPKQEKYRRGWNNRVSQY